MTFWVIVSCFIYELSFYPYNAKVINKPEDKDSLGDFLGMEKEENLLFVWAAE